MNNEYLMHFNPFHDKSNGQFTSARGSNASKTTSTVGSKKRKSSLKSNKHSNKTKRSTTEMVAKGKKIAQYLLMKNSKRIIKSASDDMQWSTYRALNKAIKYLEE